MRPVVPVLLALAAFAPSGGCSRRGGSGYEAPAATIPGEAAPDAEAPAPGLAADSSAGTLEERPIEPPSPLPGAEANVPEAVEFTSTDGVLIHASLWRTGDPEAPAVVLAHQARSDRSEWAPFVHELRARAPGLTVLALDLRGHGESTRAGETTIRWKDFSNGDAPGLRRWSSCTSDVQAAVAWLRHREEGSIPRAIGLVGSSIGSTSVIRAAANDGVAGPGHVAAVVALSPGLSYFSVPIVPSLETLKVRSTPVFVVGARDDSNDVARTAQEMATILAENLQVQLYDEGGHGVAVAAAHPEVIGLIIDFLKSRLGL
jgi:pimeloyl-ACP methyl ester carboxylesterase